MASVSTAGMMVSLKTDLRVPNTEQGGHERRIIQTLMDRVHGRLASKGVEQQTYRSCMGLLKLAEKYSDELLNAACKKALSYTLLPSYKRKKHHYNRFGKTADRNRRQLLHTESTRYHKRCRLLPEVNAYDKPEYT